MKDPLRLFRYFGPEASDIFAEGKLWLSAAKDFNDIFEVLPRYDRLMTEQVDRALKVEFAFLHPSVPVDWPTYKKDMAASAKEVISEGMELYPAAGQAKFSEHFGVVCFCENVESVLMWGHYTKCHQGFAVEFDSAHRLFEPTSFGRVEYSMERPFAEAKEHRKILLTKSLEWKYEQEHRLIKPFAEAELGKRRDRREKYYLPLPLDAVKAVYLGCRVPQKAREEILASLKPAGASHIQRYMMTLHPSEYRLVPVPLEQWKSLPGDAVAEFDAFLKAGGL